MTTPKACGGVHCGGARDHQEFPEAERKLLGVEEELREARARFHELLEELRALRQGIAKSQKAPRVAEPRVTGVTGGYGQSIEDRGLSGVGVYGCLRKR